MIRIQLQIDLDYEVGEHGADFIFNVHAAHTSSQAISCLLYTSPSPRDS